MAGISAIEWCDSTFNPWLGCTKISPACDHCYAEAQMDTRLHRVSWGANMARVRTSPKNWRNPLLWNDEPFYECGCGYRGTMSDLTTDAVHGCGPKFSVVRRRVFCASLADVFDNEVDPAWRADLFALIRATPDLDWLLLTKRIGNCRSSVLTARDSAHKAGNRDLVHWLQCWLDGRPPHNVWLGATICNQAEADRDVPKLRATPARVRFLSIEPMLGKVDLTGLVCLPCPNAEHVIMDPTTGAYECCHRCDFTGVGDEWGIDWVIAGGESGPLARPSHPDWFRSLRDQCAAAGVPFLFKQWGEWWEVDGDARDWETGGHEPIEVGSPEAHELWNARTDTLLTIDGRRFTLEALPEDVPGRLLSRIGKKAAGRLLDGRQHNGFPTDTEGGA